MAKRTVAQIRREIAGLVPEIGRELDSLVRYERERYPDALASMERTHCEGVIEGLRMALEVIDGQ